MGKKARKSLEDHIGLPIGKVSELSSQEETILVKNRTGKKLRFTKNNNPGKMGRGSPLLALNRITTMEEVNARIDAL